MTTDSRLSAVRAALEARGYDIERRTTDFVARPLEETDPVGVPGALRVVPAATRPRAVLGAVGRGVDEGLTTLFAAHDVEATEIRSVLTDPPGLRATDGDQRTFYNGPGRFRAGEFGFACCRSERVPVWREEPAAGVTGDGTHHVLYANGEAVAAFDAAESLSCPAQTAFPCAYNRDDRGRFTVVDTDTGRTLGRFPSVAEMKQNGYRPVPEPVVPDHIVDGYLPESWSIATVKNDRVVDVSGA